MAWSLEDKGDVVLVAGGKEKIALAGMVKKSGEFRLLFPIDEEDEVTAKQMLFDYCYSDILANTFEAYIQAKGTWISKEDFKAWLAKRR